ncbi:MAG: hypothetical protein Q7R86_00010 [bacterium]|nr:hypothetical protein [bacterium]
MAIENSGWQEGESNKEWERKRAPLMRAVRMSQNEGLAASKEARHEIVDYALQDAWLLLEKRGYVGQLGLLEWESRDEDRFSITVLIYYATSREKAGKTLLKSRTTEVVGEVAMAYSSLKLGVVFHPECGVGMSHSTANKMEHDGRQVTYHVIVPEPREDE